MSLFDPDPTKEHEQPTPCARCGHAQGMHGEDLGICLGPVKSVESGQQPERCACTGFVAPEPQAGERP